MSRASEDVLGSLHEALAQTLLIKLKSGECTAADLNVVRAFLKDNGIECVPERNETMKDLLASLPDGEDFDSETKLLS